MLRLFPTLLCTLLLSLATEVRAISYTVEITQQELQEKVEAMMPLKKKKLFVLVTLSEPQVELISESNEIGLQTKISIAGPGISESGIANIKGTLEYRPEKSAFYLLNPEVVGLNFDNLSSDMNGLAINLAQKTIESATKKRPVYRFKDDKLKDQMAKALLQSIAVENNVLKISMKLF
jgi:hypothetical protein